SHHALAHDQAPRHYKATIAATKIVRDRDRVLNNGLTPDQVAAVTHRPIRPLTIREAGNGPVIAGTRTDRLDPDGRTLTVYRPHQRPQATPIAAASEQPGRAMDLPTHAAISSHGRNVPSAPIAPRAFADATPAVLPVREVRMSGGEPSRSVIP